METTPSPLTPAENKLELVRRMNAKDLAATMEMIAADAVYFWSNGSAMFGKAAIAEAMHVNFDRIADDTYGVADVTWLVEAKTSPLAFSAFTRMARWTARRSQAEGAEPRCRGASTVRGGSCTRT